MISYHILKCRKVSISVITAQSSWQRWKMRPPSENNLSAAAFEGKHASVHLYIEATHVWIAIQRWRCVCCISKIIINLFIHSKWTYGCSCLAENPAKKLEVCIADACSEELLTDWQLTINVLSANANSRHFNSWGRLDLWAPLSISVMWSETVGLRTKYRSRSWICTLWSWSWLGVASPVLCCETRSCHARRHNDLQGHSNFPSTIYSFSILCLEHHYWVAFNYLKAKCLYFRWF